MKTKYYKMAERECVQCHKPFTARASHPTIHCSQRCVGKTVASKISMGPYRHQEWLDARITYANNGCWEWHGRMDRHGYGQVHIEGRNQFAHRLVYTWRVGPIPDGLALNHLCSNKCCVNPQHLEPVTIAENRIRDRLRRTHCKHGHLLDEQNTYLHEGRWRHCRTCRKQTAAAYYVQRKSVPA